jgi:hydrogenase maturation protease
LATIRPLLVLAWGNPSRGDDALGPLFAARLPRGLDRAQAQRVELVEDFQLQVEHALDLDGRERVLFVDASVACASPFEAAAITAAPDAALTTHALSPQAVLQVYRRLFGRDAPPATLLAIRGRRFELGEALSTDAARHLDEALAWAAGWVERG